MSLSMGLCEGNLEEGSSTGDLELDEGALGMGVLLSQEAPCRGPRGGLLYWGT